MYAVELIQQILRDMRQHALRSLLAMFGIIWGTVAVVMLLALGEGFYESNQKNIMRLVDNAIVIFPGVTSMPYRNFPQGRPVLMKAAQVMEIEHNVPQVKAVSPVIRNNGKLSLGNVLLDARFLGVAPSYDELTKKEILPGGRFINQLDIEKHRKVLFLGDGAANTLFKDQTAVGKTVYLNQIPFIVIGVQKTPENTGEWHRNEAIIPYSTAIDLWGDQNIRQVLLAAKQGVPLKQFQEVVLRYFAGQYHFNPEDKMALNVFDPSETLAFVTWFFRSIEIFLGLCGAMTLAVGGIGVANIMYLIISERTKEIGLRMALGARYYHILWQIMLEALMIVLLGSLIGFLISFIGIQSLSLFTLPEWLGQPQLSVPVFIATTSVLVMVGLIAGFFPAKKAANMKPVTALAF